MNESLEGKDIYQQAEEVGNRAYGYASAGRFADAVAIWGSMPKPGLNQTDNRLEEIRDRYLTGVVEELVTKMTSDDDVNRDRLIELISGEESGNKEFINDLVTGLRLPPTPRTPYSGRPEKDGKRESLEEFLNREWGDYIRHHLLYSEHIRLIDPGLHKAIYYRAKQEGASSDEFMFRLGILTRHHLLGFEPPENLRRQVELLKHVRTVTRAQ